MAGEVNLTLDLEVNLLTLDLGYQQMHWLAGDPQSGFVCMYSGNQGLPTKQKLVSHKEFTSGSRPVLNETTFVGWNFQWVNELMNFEFDFTEDIWLNE